MEPSEGEIVWVHVGKTDHPAKLLSKDPDSDGDVLVKWTSNNTTDLVPLNSIKEQIAPRKRRKPSRLCNENLTTQKDCKKDSTSFHVIGSTGAKKTTISHGCEKKRSQKSSSTKTIAHLEVRNQKCNNSNNNGRVGQRTLIRRRTLPLRTQVIRHLEGREQETNISNSIGRGRGRTLPAWMTKNRSISNGNDIHSNGCGDEDADGDIRSGSCDETDAISGAGTQDCPQSSDKGVRSSSNKSGSDKIGERKSGWGDTIHGSNSGGTGWGCHNNNNNGDEEGWIDGGGNNGGWGNDGVESAQGCQQNLDADIGICGSSKKSGWGDTICASNDGGTGWGCHNNNNNGDEEECTNGGGNNGGWGKDGAESAQGCQQNLDADIGICGSSKKSGWGDTICASNDGGTGWGCQDNNNNGGQEGLVDRHNNGGWGNDGAESTQNYQQNTDLDIEKSRWVDNLCGGNCRDTGWGSNNDSGNNSGWGRVENIQTSKKNSDLDLDDSNASVDNLYDVNGEDTGCEGHNDANSSIIFPIREKVFCHDTPAEIIHSTCKARHYREERADYYLHFKFRDRLLIEEKILTKETVIAKYKEIWDNPCELLGIKVTENEGSYSLIYGRYSIRLYYYQNNGPGLMYSNVQDELEKIADFKSLPPSKVICRIELLMSSAVKNRGAICTFSLDHSKFEEIPEHHHVGCGFIPPFMLVYLLKGVTDVDAVQVRIVGGTLGIFKGVLVKKSGIEKIQLPLSMKKVNKSRFTASNQVYILFNNLFPSKPCKMLGRYLNPVLDNPPPKAKPPNKMSNMIQQMLLGAGVPEDILGAYVRESQKFTECEHAWCAGVCDFTGCLPEGTIFLSGVGVSGPSLEVFITRSPCTEINDAKVLKTVSKQPPAMSDENWELLSTMKFGIIVFASPDDPLTKSLPEQLAGGDLDGDLYFVCWNYVILQSINRYRLIQSRSIAEEEEELTSCTNDEEDPLIGAQFRRNSQEAVVQTRCPDGKYLVMTGTESEILTQEEIQDGTQIVEKIISHKGAKIEILWGNKVKTQELLSEMKNKIPTQLVDYAVKNELIGKRGWAWCKKLLRDAEPIEIMNHRGNDQVIEFEVLFDDGDKMWKPRRDVDTDLLVKYAKEQDILEEEEWHWLKSEMDVVDKNWFAVVQNKMTDVNQLRGHTSLIEAFYKAFNDIQDMNNIDSRYFGHAYKQANDLHKHSGHVLLPIHLHKTVPKAALKFITFFTPSKSIRRETRAENMEKNDIANI